MSFSKTVSVVAALASIFSVGLASWKISEDIKNSQTSPLEQKIQDLEKQIEEANKKKVEQVSQPQVQTVQQPVILSPVVAPPPPPPVPTETQE